MAFLALAILGQGAQSSAVTARGPVAGAFSRSPAAQSDLPLQFPFSRPPVFASVAAAVGANTVELRGPAWADGWWGPAKGVFKAGPQFRLMIRSGAAEGATADILNSTGRVLTLARPTSEFAGMAAGDRIEIVPHWTLATFYPAEWAGQAFAESTSPEMRGTVVAVTERSGEGAPETVRRFYFYSGHWREIGQPVSVDAGAFALSREVGVRVTHPAGRTFSFAGRVEAAPQRRHLPATASRGVDVPLHVLTPRPVALGATGLTAGERPVFVTSLNAIVRGDLYIRSGPVEGGSDPVNAQYFYFQQGAWRQLGVPVATGQDGAAALDVFLESTLRRSQPGQPARDWIFTPFNSSP